LEQRVINALLRFCISLQNRRHESFAAVIAPIAYSRSFRRSIVLLALVLGAAVSMIDTALAQLQTVDLKNLQPTLETIRVANKLPALGAAILTIDGVQSVAVTGTRKRGDATLATDNDLWHLGSNTKAMTATMIARLVERGQMRWDQTLGETFPELAGKMNADTKAITVTQLLSHRSGLDRSFNSQKYVDRADLRAARVSVVEDAIASKLNNKPGEKFRYSNWGYTVAGAMAERAAGDSWEQLMRREVFAPLKILSAGFGGTGTVGKIDQPWPHTEDGKPTDSNGVQIDNVPTMGPAGTVHMSLTDWAKFVAEHLRGSTGKSAYLKKETFEKLHTAVGDDYALGLHSFRRDWAGGNALNHNGDNTMNYALMWAAPQKNFAVIVVTNQSGAAKATDDVAAALMKAWQAKP
jgi:CubicO group peptidase (beta-lactamase class C family)